MRSSVAKYREEISATLLAIKEENQKIVLLITNEIRHLGATTSLNPQTKKPVGFPYKYPFQNENPQKKFSVPSLTKKLETKEEVEEEPENQGDA